MVSALAKALESRMTAAIILPAFKVIHHDHFAIRPYEPVPDFLVPMGPGWSRAEVYHTRMAGTGIDVFLIGSGDYFYRDGIYDDPVTKEGYPDNMQRFIFFMKAALELVRRLGVTDVIHCHDWQTALIPGLVRTNLDRDPMFGRIGTLFTIHNLAYQGIYPTESLYWAGIDSVISFQFSTSSGESKLHEGRDPIRRSSQYSRRKLCSRDQSGPELVMAWKGSSDVATRISGA